MTEAKHLTKLINECDDLLSICLFDKSKMDADRIAKCLAYSVETLSWYKQELEKLKETK